jgi:hypothetical protein
LSDGIGTGLDNLQIILSYLGNLIWANKTFISEGSAFIIRAGILVITGAISPVADRVEHSECPININQANTF